MEIYAKEAGELLKSQRANRKEVEEAKTELVPKLAEEPKQTTEKNEQVVAMKPESIVPVKPESHSFKLEKFFAPVKRNQSKQRSKIETAADEAQAAYISRPWHDA
jgi:hypothetical protein